MTKTTTTIKNISFTVAKLSKQAELSADETRFLFETAQGRNGASRKDRLQARNELAERNKGFVHHIASEFRNKGLDYEDLVNEGMMGIIEAIERFDLEKNFKFSTYSVFWIKLYMRTAILEQVPAIRLPLKTKIKRENFAAISLDKNIGSDTDEEECRLIDTLMDPSALVQDSFVEKCLKTDVRKLLSVLDEREVGIIKAHSGIGCEEESLSKIAADWGMTKEGVRQVEKRAILKLRKLAEEKNMHDYLVAA